jgi:hypothetical protein
VDGRLRVGEDVMRKFLLALLLAALPAAANELVLLKLRGDVTQPYYIVDGGETKPAYALILLPGGNGAVRYRGNSDGTAVPGSSLGYNFLIRAADLFAGDGFVAAIMDAPSDLWNGMTYEFRSGSKHAGDIAAIDDDLRKRYPGVKVILVGTSNGTISAAYAGRALGNNLDGVVLTSSVFRPNMSSIFLNDFPFREIASPLLFVHHAEDGCRVTPYADARAVTGFPLITVKGGDIGLLGGNPCEAISHHGFLGREKDVVAAIRNWAAGKPYPTTIE